MIATPPRCTSTPVHAPAEPGTCERRPSSAAWPLEEGTTAPFEGSPTWLADVRIIQDGNVYVMATQRGAEKVLLADLAYIVRNVDARGA